MKNNLTVEWRHRRVNVPPKYLTAELALKQQRFINLLNDEDLTSETKAMLMIDFVAVLIREGYASIREVKQSQEDMFTANILKDLGL